MIVEQATAMAQQSTAHDACLHHHSFSASSSCLGQELGSTLEVCRTLISLPFLTAACAPYSFLAEPYRAAITKSPEDVLKFF